MLPNESPLRRFLFPNRYSKATGHTFLPPRRQTSSLENKNAISQKKGERQQSRLFSLIKKKTIVFSL